VAKILVADDNSNIQKMVGLALKDQGIDVVAVGNGEAAVRKISDIKPDLVLADVFMPVRNGYEVCKYVKDDETLKHIPVILLVGAFDPLDEQEAQRVGADGVLKKPFVPPDPLISMVKSALARAGIAVGPPAPVVKAPEAPRKSTPEWLKPAAAAKLAALSEAKNGEPEEETADVPEEFPSMPQQLKIAAGQGPVAFGGMLDTQEEEDEASLQITAHSPLEDERNWGGHGEEEEEVQEEEESSPHARWRPGGLDEALEKVAVPSVVPSVAPGNETPDWRDAAFHGNSPAKSVPPPPWQTGGAKAPAAEAASVEGVAVSTLEAKPAESPVPFSGDAWAAAMAAGVEEKLKREQEGKVVEETPAEEAAAPEAVKEAAPANSWFTTSSTPWETEARKASQLAATWDAPAAEAPAAEAAHVEPVAEEAAPVVESEPEAVAAGSHYVAETIHEPAAVEATHTPKWADTWEEAAKAAKLTAAVHEENPNETQEVPAYKAEVPEWHAPAAIVEEPVEDAHTEETPVAAAPVEAIAPVAVPEEKQPNMDELVARVLAKMSPEMLQKVTHDILRPVIEALVKDELNNHKS
jgi:CheY-like chemotaxis protein